MIKFFYFEYECYIFVGFDTMLHFCWIVNKQKKNTKRFIYFLFIFKKKDKIRLKFDKVRSPKCFTKVVVQNCNESLKK